MKSYAISWKSESESGTDLIRSELSLEDICEFYYKVQHWLTILQISEVDERFSCLTRRHDGEFLLDGEE